MDERSEVDEHEGEYGGEGGLVPTGMIMDERGICHYDFFGEGLTHQEKLIEENPRNNIMRKSPLKKSGKSNSDVIEKSLNNYHVNQPPRRGRSSTFERPMTIPSINPFIKDTNPLRTPHIHSKTKNMTKVVRTLPGRPVKECGPGDCIPAESHFRDTGQGSGSENVTTSRKKDTKMALEKEVADNPVESRRPGGFGPAESRPRDDRHNSTPDHPDDTDWCPCGSCGATTESPGTDWIFCDSCLKWFHGSCIGLTNEEIQAMAHPTIKWSCVTCESQVTQQKQSKLGPEYILCKRCLPHIKNYKGIKGLRKHYHHAHPEFIAELSQQSQSQEKITDFTEKIGKLKQTVRVLKRVPKCARVITANKLETVINACIIKNDVKSWEDLMLFSYITLQQPKRTENLANTVKRNVITFNENEIKPFPKPSKSSLAKRIEAKVQDGDINGAVKLLSSNDELAKQDSHTLSLLQSKHPTPSRPISVPDPPNPTDECFIATEKDVLSAFHSFACGSASGIDGLRPQILKDLTAKSTGEVGRRLLAAITKLCNLMLQGNVNNLINPVLYGASLCALNKKDGGIRPIAVGNTFRRLTAKVACHSIKDKIGEYFRPTQLGFATKGGCEAAIHAVRSYLKSNAGSNKVLIKIDFKNAFNSIERDNMLCQIKSKTPQLYPFLWQCYVAPTHLFFGNNTISSQVGAQQGDPAGPMAFSLTIHHIIESLCSELNIWYLDDGTLAGDPDTVLRDFKRIIEEARKLGLEINPTKCEIHFLSDVNQQVFEKFSEVSPGIRITTDLLCLLGAPLTEKAAEYLLEEKLKEITLLLSRLPDLSSHVAYYLLKHCFAVPKLTYLLRTTPTWNFKEVIEKFDNKIKATLEIIINTTLTHDQWQLASLPTKYGGIGIRKASDLSVPAFLASVNGSYDLVCNMLPNYQIDKVDIPFYADAMKEWNSTCPDAPEPAIPSIQRNWDLINVGRISNALQFSSDLDMARYKASLKQESSTWLNVLPAKSINTLLDNNTFRISVALRLGCSICVSHICNCGKSVDQSGIHGLSCSKSAGRFSRHAALNGIIKGALSSAEIPSTLEPVGLSRDDGKRPDGMTFVPWSNGKPLVWDATCTDTLAPTHVSTCSKLAGSAAEVAANMKLNKYKDIRDQNYIFIPFAVETLGPWCEDAKCFVDILGKRISRVTGEPRSRDYLSQRISIAIQRGNAASVMGTLPPGIPMDEIYYLL